MMNITVRLEVQIVDGQMKIMVHAPMGNQEEKDLTCQILAQAIPIVIQYQPSILLKPNGAAKPMLPPVAPTH